ncbi:phage tail terminator protein [Dyella terrae]|uniref:phage tail terminator protein n=1 Tax=Dyella terrae TaxID=522259 RepID=UPI001EFCA750|nr:hypothetical protein [Dyella terrae]ULU26595.1 hypothetical protein DYST_03541 [Dyella terrae]
MNFEPFDIELAITQLQTNAPLLTGGVFGAVEYAAVKSLRDFRPPCAFVLLAREKGIPNVGNTTGEQHAGVTFGVVVIARNYRASTRGIDAAELLRPLLGQVRSAFMGWVPKLPGARPTQFVQGDLVDYDQANVLWTDVYRTQHSLQR